MFADIGMACGGFEDASFKEQVGVEYEWWRICACLVGFYAIPTSLNIYGMFLFYLCLSFFDAVINHYIIPRGVAYALIFTSFRGVWLMQILLILA